MGSRFILFNGSTDIPVDSPYVSYLAFLILYTDLTKSAHIHAEEIIKYDYSIKTEFSH
jgi:hypothetical protein